MWDMQKVCEAFYSIYGELIGVDFEVTVTPKDTKEEDNYYVKHDESPQALPQEPVPRPAF